MGGAGFAGVGVVGLWGHEGRGGPALVETRRITKVSKEQKEVVVARVWVAPVRMVGLSRGMVGRRWARLP